MRPIFRNTSRQLCPEVCTSGAGRTHEENKAIVQKQMSSLCYCWLQWHPRKVPLFAVQRETGLRDSLKLKCWERGFGANQCIALANCSHPMVLEKRSSKAVQLLTGLCFNA